MVYAVVSKTTDYNDHVGSSPSLGTKSNLLFPHDTFAILPHMHEYLNNPGLIDQPDLPEKSFIPEQQGFVVFQREPAANQLSMGVLITENDAERRITSSSVVPFLDRLVADEILLGWVSDDLQANGHTRTDGEIRYESTGEAFGIMPTGEEIKLPGFREDMPKIY